MWVCSGYIKLLSVFTELCDQAKKRTFFSKSSFIYSNRTFKWLIIFVWPNLWYHLQCFYNLYKTNINIFASIDWTRYLFTSNNYTNRELDLARPDVQPLTNFSQLIKFF